MEHIRKTKDVDDFRMMATSSYLLISQSGTGCAAVGRVEDDERVEGYCEKSYTMVIIMSGR